MPEGESLDFIHLFLEQSAKRSIKNVVKFIPCLFTFLKIPLCRSASQKFSTKKYKSKKNTILSSNLKKKLFWNYGWTSKYYVHIVKSIVKFKCLVFRRFILVSTLKVQPLYNSFVIVASHRVEQSSLFISLSFIHVR